MPKKVNSLSRKAPSLTPNPKELEDKLNELKESLKGKDQHWHVAMGWKNDMFSLPSTVDR